jgi:hypothetical protein
MLRSRCLPASVCRLPMRLSPMRLSPMRLSPMRLSPMRLSPMRLPMHLPMHLLAARCPTCRPRRPCRLGALAFFRCLALLSVHRSCQRCQAPASRCPAACRPAACRLVLVLIFLPSPVCRSKGRFHRFYHRSCHRPALRRPVHRSCRQRRFQPPALLLRAPSRRL